MKNTIGQAECIDGCATVLCGRNAECTSINHEPQCTCKQGFRGNPNDDRVGCQQIECETDSDCSNEKFCENYMCKIGCLINNPCGHNALCSAEQHTTVCYCQPGFTGDAYTGCTVIDFCADLPCGPGANCNNARGSYKCQCPVGTVGDPYNDGCVAPVECEQNTDCPTAAECVQDNGIPKCRGKVDSHLKVGIHFR